MFYVAVVQPVWNIVPAIRSIRTIRVRKIKTQRLIRPRIYRIERKKPPPALPFGGDNRSAFEILDDAGHIAECEEKD